MTGARTGRGMPPLLLAAAVLFWGWQTGFWWFALPISVILEAARWSQWRWALTPEDFNRLLNLCIVLLVSLLSYLLTNRTPTYFIYILYQWLPCIALPLMVAQAYSVGDRIAIRPSLPKWGNAKANQLTSPPWRVNFSYAYFALCIFAASAANRDELSFYLGMSGLAAIVLWQIRPKRTTAIAWLCLMLVAGGVGFIGQIGLHKAHLALEQQAINWLGRFYGQTVDPLRRNTSLGDVGTLKLSNNIVFRVTSKNPELFPLLLRESTYNKYDAALWIATQVDFKPVQADPLTLDEARAEDEDNPLGRTWRLGLGRTQSLNLTIDANLTNGKGLLRLPVGAFQVDKLAVTKLERNQYGSVTVENRVNPIHYQVQFSPGYGLDSPPEAEDLEVPKDERAAIAKVIAEANLQSQVPQDVLDSLQIYFQTKFEYSLDLLDKGKHITPVSAFLLQHRRGHCEYFATATTLILRSLGIPARYAVGYSVHEFNALENRYVVRGRNAHAWTMVYLNGTWQSFDTTPPTWREAEDDAAPKWGIINDFFSWFSFQSGEWIRTVGVVEKLRQWWWLIILVILVFSILRQQFSPNQWVRRGSAKPTTTATTDASVQLGLDSEFYLIEQALATQGLTRASGESLKAWLKRLNQELANQLSPQLIADLQAIIELHYRYRFDPQGIPKNERSRLKTSIQAWLTGYAAAVNATTLRKP